MLSERSQMQKPIWSAIPLIGNVQDRQIHRGRKEISGPQGLGEGCWGAPAPQWIDRRPPLGVMRMSWNQTEVVIALNVTELCTLIR